MESSPPGSAGFMNAFRTLGDGLVAGVQDRFALFGVEFQEEKIRLIQTFIWISAAVFTGMIAISFASLTLVYLFWESARLTVLGGLTGLYTGGLLVIIIAFRRYLAHQPRPFAATLDELNADRSCIRNLS